MRKLFLKTIFAATAAVTTGTAFAADLRNPTPPPAFYAALKRGVAAVSKAPYAIADATAMSGAAYKFIEHMEGCGGGSASYWGNLRSSAKAGKMGGLWPESDLRAAGRVGVSPVDWKHATMPTFPLRFD